MIESRKQAVSIRINGADVGRVKRLAQRLGARDSDIIRFALKVMLTRLGPLCDPAVRGRNLVPVFVESGADLLRFFDLDASRLDTIINDGVESSRRVDRDDIALLALTGAQEEYAASLLSEVRQGGDGQRTPGETAATLRQYLYAKYVYRGSEKQPASERVKLAAVGGQHE